LQYEAKKDAPQVVFTRARADSGKMEFDFQFLKQRRLAHEVRLTSMKNYISTETVCRSQMLLSYFGEEDAPRCGVCDVCLRRNKLQLSDLEFGQITEQVKSLLQKRPYTISQVVDKTPNLKEEQTLRTIQWLLDNEELILNDKNQLIFSRDEK
jgi:ATP-dependent DNA helicase RecQ